MGKPIKLSAIVDGLEMVSDTMFCYLDRETGRVEMVMEDEMLAAEDEVYEEADAAADDDGAAESGEEAGPLGEGLDDEGVILARAIAADSESERYLPLPSSFDIHEYAIMDEFCRSRENLSLAEELCRAIRGSGAFRRFKDCIYAHGIQDQWYRFRGDALKEIAIDWCEGYHLEYEDDTAEPMEP